MCPPIKSSQIMYFGVCMYVCINQSNQIKPCMYVCINQSNQVLGDQAVVDPSKVEELVKGQVQRRKAQHEARNQAAKLTPQEKKDKKKKKLLEDTSKELQVR